jgi:hypothetical protein
MPGLCAEAEKSARSSTDRTAPEGRGPGAGKITIERTSDAALIQRLITTPAIWKDVIDDFAPSPEEYKPLISEGMIYLLAQDQDDIVGLFIFQMRSWTEFEFHAVVLPEMWLKLKAKPAALAAFDWIWNHYPTCQRIVGYVPVLKHRTRLRLAPKLGMTQFGLDPNSFQKDGRLWDRACFGISRPADGF